DQPEAAADPEASRLRRQQRLDGGIAVALVHAHARVARETLLQRGRLARLQFAARDPVLLAQRAGQQPWRTRIRSRTMLRAAGVDGGAVRRQRGVFTPLQQRANAIGRFPGPPRMLAIELVQAAPGVGIEREAGARLGHQRIAQRQQHGVLEDVGMVAGVEGVAIVHRGRRAWSREQVKCFVAGRGNGRPLADEGHGSLAAPMVTSRYAFPGRLPGSRFQSMPSILLVEGEAAIAGTVLYALREEGYDPTHCLTAGDALALAAERAFDLAILDVGLPDLGGFALCRRLREHSDLPVIFLTARQEEADRILGFELGADDDVSKPFSPR